MKSCPVCNGDVPVVIRNGRGGRQAVYCSISCRGKADYRRRVLPNKKPAREVVCDWCVKKFVTIYPAQHFCSDVCRFASNAVRQQGLWRANNPKPDNWNYECDQCGVLVERSYEQGFVSRGKFGRFCVACSLERQRIRYRKKTTKRRSSVKPSNVSVERLVETYGAICWLCNESIDLGLPRTSRMGATVDHVVPLSKGGSDEFDNLMLAHWICNNRKSDKVVSDA